MMAECTRSTVRYTGFAVRFCSWFRVPQICSVLSDRTQHFNRFPDSSLAGKNFGSTGHHESRLIDFR